MIRTPDVRIRAGAVARGVREAVLGRIVEQLPDECVRVHEPRLDLRACH